VDGILETALYVSDLDRSAAFYARVFGFETIADDSPRMRALAVPGRQVLLLFKAGASGEGSRIPGGYIPGHDAAGIQHLAFAIGAGELSTWEERLRGLEVTIESRVRWSRGGTSLYFRDPDGHSIELVTPGCWEIY
jgi:catechol 2,3-dioxygenase-like lactoylglutathione lyase family enzyme